MKNNACLVAAVLLSAFSADLRAAFLFDSSSGNVTSDFRYCMVGNLGAAPNVNNQLVYDSGNKTLVLEGKYNQQASVGLNATSDTGPSTGNYTGNVTSSMTFTYVSGNSTNVNIGMGVRVSAAGGTINTYPTYRVLLAGGNFTLQKNYSFNGTTDVGTYTLGSTLGSTNVYQMDLSAVDIGVNGFGKIVSLTASLYENGGLLQSLSYTDTPTQNYGPTAGASIGSGYIGMYAGEAGISTGTFRGISISQFSVGVPEPSVFALVGMAAAALGLACRRKRNDATLGPRRDVRREG